RSGLEHSADRVEVDFFRHDDEGDGLGGPSGCPRGRVDTLSHRRESLADRHGRTATVTWRPVALSRRYEKYAGDPYVSTPASSSSSMPARASAIRTPAGRSNARVPQAVRRSTDGPNWRTSSARSAAPNS